jgi:hypothetical protein
MKFFSVLLCAYLAGCTIHTAAERPTLNLLARQQRHPGSFAVDLSAVPTSEICYTGPGRGLCVAGVHDSMAQGLEEVLSSHIQNAPSGPQYRAIFKLSQFFPTQAMGSDGTSSVMRMIWQFELLDPGGKRIVGLARTTTGLEQMHTKYDVERAVQSALTVVLEEISAGLAEASW